MLTVLLPTRDRPTDCARVLRFLRQNGFAHPIVVLDASAEADAAAVRAACADTAEYRHFPRSYRMADKLAEAVQDVATPYVLQVPDDDAVLPHAVEQALAFLDAHPDFVVAHGYTLGFARHGDDIDIHRVVSFTPSIADESPLRRHYELFRRYQSFYLGVFRTPVFASAVAMASAMRVVLFRELTVMSTSILQGKVARLPLVHALRGTTASHAALEQSHPLFWALHDSASFFDNYRIFRESIANFARGRQIAVPDGVGLEQLLDLSYATWLGGELDLGVLNHTVRRLLGDPLPPLRGEPEWAGWQEPRAGDVTHRSATGDRRYVWRRAVLEAEPRHEITIDPDELRLVERELEAYR